MYKPSTQRCHFIETSALFCSVNRLTGFYIKSTLGCNCLRYSPWQMINYMKHGSKSFPVMLLWGQWNCSTLNYFYCFDNDINRKGLTISILINMIYHANINNAVHTFLTVRNLCKIPRETKFK